MPFRLRSAFSRSVNAPRPTARRPAGRLRVEALEARDVPAAQLTVTPITWDAIGLDSNRVTDGPDQFVVGARVTNTGDAPAANLVTDFVWDSTNANINLIDAGRQTLPTLAAGASQDFYFNVRITRTAAAHDTTRRYHITAAADGVTPASTPNSPTDYRQLYVEKILSQARNSVDGFTGPTTVQVGQTVTYTLTASTSTAYPQLAVFSGFDNRMFQVQSVGVTYSTPTGATNTTFYANATIWGANPAGADYNTTTSAVNPAFPGGKAGGTVVTTVTVRIVGAGTTTLYPTISDFSGSSFHYNADYATRAMTVTAISPRADLNLTKAVSNAAPNVGDTVTFTVTLTNQGPDAASGVEVTDALPAGLSFVSATPAQGTYDPLTGKWAVGALANGASTTLTVRARVDAPAQVTNTARVTATQVPDPDPSDDQASATLTPKAADLSLSKAVDNAAANVGDTVTFTLSLTNTGPDAATGVRVTDLLPAGLEFVSATPSQGTYSPSTGVWSVGTVNSAATATLIVRAQLTSANPVTNTATVASDVYDPDPADNTGTATVTPPRANLGLTKAVDNATPNVGDTVTFTITLTNQGPNAATGVQVHEALPGGLALVSATAGQGTYDAASGVWSVGTLASGATTTLTVRASVTGPNAVTNIARVSRADQYDPDPANNTASAGIAPPRADLSLTKSVDVANPDVGDVVTFAVTIANAGPDAATGVSVTDLLPAGLTFVSAAPTQGTYTAATGVWSVGSIANGGTATLVVRATVNRPDAVTNLAHVATADQYDPNGVNNSATAGVTPRRADLAITKAVSNATPTVGDTVTFTISLANTGPDDATGVTASDLLPTGLTFVSATPTQGSYDPATGVWAVGAVANGASATLTIDALVANTGTVVNVAQVTASDRYDPDPSDNASSVTLTNLDNPPPTVDLAVAKGVSDATPNVGDTVTFTVTLANTALAAATGVRVTDLLPTGLAFVTATPTQGAYDPASGVWTVGDVAGGTTVTLTVDAVVTSPTAMTNVARVTAAGETDSDPTNDSASAAVTPRQADLNLTKAVNNAAPNVGQTVTFTVTLTNQGADEATGVSVTDRLPSGLAFVTASPSQGSYDPATGAWTIGTVAAGATVTLTIDATVTSPATATNFAQVTASDVYDPDAADNAASAAVNPPRADLSVTKAVDNASPNFGDMVTFTVTVTNTGPDGATGVRLSDVLPSGLTYQSHTAAGTAYDPATGVWTVGTLANGGTATLTVAARVATSRPVTNVVQVLSLDQYDADPSDDRAARTLSPAQADLAVSKTVDVANPVRDQVVTFTVTVTNTGTSDATGVQVTDLLPAGLAYQSSTPSQGTYTAATGVWVIGGLANGASATLTVAARVTDPGPLTNEARISTADQFDPDPTDNQSQATVTGQVTDLAVGVTASTANPNVGGPITFTVALTNRGPAAATNIVVTDLLPPGITFVSATPGAGSYNPTTGAWTVPSLAVGQTVTLALTGTVSASGAYTDTARLSALDQFDSDLSNNQDSDSVRTAAADLSLTKAVSNATPNVGDQVTFTIVLTNTGADDATGIRVTDQLPAGLTFVSANASQGTYTAATGVWDVGTVVNGATATLSVVVTVASPAAITNVAAVTAADQYDPDGTDNADQATVTPQRADLAVTKSVDNATPNVGDVVTFTVTLANTGPDAATAVQVTDQLPAGLALLSAVPSQGAYDANAGVWTVGDVASESSATLTIRATVSTPAAVTNTAGISRADQYDPDATDNTGSATVTPRQADLHLTKAVDNAAPNVGDVVRFTLTLTNDGPDAATAVTVTDQLPAGLTFAAATASQGVYDNVTGTWTVGTVANGATVTLTIDAIVATPAAVTNLATVTSLVYDPDGGDNAGSATVTPRQADLGLTKTIDNAAPNVGDQVTFTITVTNTGPDAATGVQVTDQLPAGLTFVSANPSQGTYDANSGVWVIGTVGTSGSATLTVLASVVGHSPITNLARVTQADQYDPDPTDNADDAALDAQEADLGVAVAVSNPSPRVGETVTITVSLTNSGPDTANNVAVTDLLPAGLQLTAAAPSQGTYAGDSGVWTVGDVPAGGSVTLTLQVVVTRAGTFTDAASVTAADQFDPNLSNNSDADGLTAPTPVVAPPTPLAIDENSAGGTSAGLLAVTGVDPSNAITWSFLTDAGGRFVINGDRVEAAPAADLNYEAATAQPIRVRATDEYGNTYDRDLVVAVNDVNEAPVNTVPGAQRVARNGSLTFSAANGNALAVADVDRPDSSIRVTLSIPAGTGRLTVPTIPIAVLVTGNGTGTVTLTGTPAAITQAMNGLVYRPPTGFVGPAPLTMATDDLGHNFFPNPLTDTDVVPIQVFNTRPQPTQPTLTYQMQMATVRTPTLLALPAARGLARYFTDVNGDPLTFSVLGSKPAGLTVKANGAVVYRPRVGFVGKVQFYVRAFDGLEYSDPILVTINVVYGLKPCGR